MADSQIVIDTRLNNKKLERDYANAVKKMEGLEKTLNEKKTKESAVAAELDKVTKKADEAKAHIATLKEEMAAIQGAMKPGGNPEEFVEAQERKPAVEAAIPEAEKQLVPLEKEADKLRLKLEACKNEVTGAEAELQKAAERAARISGEIEQAKAETAKQTEKEAELAAEAERASAAQKDFGKNTSGAATGIDKLLKRVKNLAMRVFVFSVITRALRSVKDWFMKVAKQNDETADAMARLKGALLTMAQPLLTVIIPVFTAIVNVLAAVIGKIATFLSMLGGKTAKQSADAAKALYNQGEAYEDVADSAKEASKQLMGFDELNTLQDNTAETSTDTEKASDEIVPNFEWADGVSETMSHVAKWVLIIAAGLALWKIGTMFTGPLATILTTVGKLAAGIGLVIAAIILLEAGFSDAFENGLNLKNMLTIIGGMLAAGLGISLMVGSWIPLIVGAIAGLLLALAQLTGNGGAMIEGFKKLFKGFSDFITGMFTGDMKKAAEGLVTMAKGVHNLVASIFNTLIDLIVAGLNLIQVNIPDWVPLIGGRHFGINIQNPPHIPYLAQGAVIPPNREFMAVLGDQKYGTNIEAPEDLIRKIVREETAGMGGSARLEQLLEVLIETVESIEVGDETIGKAAARYSRATARARGT